MDTLGDLSLAFGVLSSSFHSRLPACVKDCRWNVDVLAKKVVERVMFLLCLWYNAIIPTPLV